MCATRRLSVRARVRHRWNDGWGWGVERLRRRWSNGWGGGQASSPKRSSTSPRRSRSPFATSPKDGIRSSLSSALMCTTSRRISASSGTNRGPGQGDLILLCGLLVPVAKNPDTSLQGWARLGLVFEQFVARQRRIRLCQPGNAKLAIVDLVRPCGLVVTPPALTQKTDPSSSFSSLL